jgi:hypothetical protein
MYKYFIRFVGVSLSATVGLLAMSFGIIVLSRYTQDGWITMGFLFLTYVLAALARERTYKREQYFLDEDSQ